MIDRIPVPDLLRIPAGARIAWWVEFASFADSITAVQANPGSVTWYAVDRVEDDGTYVIVVIGDNRWAVNKRHHVVIDIGAVT